MSDKKHIDRIFQEKFKDFEATPSPKVWQDIQAKLNQPEKERKRIIPFWFKVAGIAALLLLFLTVGGLLVNNNTGNTTNTKVVDIENISGDSINSSNETFNNSSITNKSITETNPENLENSNSESQEATNSLNNSNVTEIASEETGEQSQEKSLNNINNKVSKNSIINPSASSVNSDTRITENSSSKDKLNSDEKTTEFITKNPSGAENNNTNPSVSENRNDTRITQNTNIKNHVNSDENGTIINPNNPSTNKNNLADNTSEINNSKSVSNVDNSELNKTYTDKQLQELNNRTAENTIAEKENTDANIEETIEEELNKIDLTIEEAIAANQDLIEEEKDEIINRWQVYANIAPVYYNSMGKGSQIDAQFDNNSKTGEVNTSYGVNVSYNVNKKLSIRTGLSSLNLSYDTNDVMLYQSIASTGSAPSALRNIDLSEGNETLTAISAENLSVAQIDNSLSPNSNAAISQRISYFEIPMELNYRIGNNKVGLNLIAGFSSFILDGNEVYSELKDEKTYIGEANNINSMSFSTNFGLGFDYKFSEKVKFNLEPTFKYQLNAFENTSGSFNPYIIGIYTGLSYKF
ncbi:outer membrane beta-barrel protein [Bizionia arctica]|uniref:Outer membrane protein beta-barrel domain-containing protein n=1 Tax=Bizionia arctica TaxID=1495645 RepID=A0A917GBS2_9FLAO|nr:outer membrane beta-barrel protein [Bizionia arctica]GGG36162.1 hypothetical protein GCM10010976_04830 [Bizionia arctica]